MGQESRRLLWAESQLRCIRFLLISIAPLSASCTAGPPTEAQVVEIVRPCLSQTKTDLNSIGAAAVAGAHSQLYADKAEQFAEACSKASEELQKRSPGHSCVVAMKTLETAGWEMQAGLEGRRSFNEFSLSEPGPTAELALTLCGDQMKEELDLPWVFGVG